MPNKQFTIMHNEIWTNSCYSTFGYRCQLSAETLQKHFNTYHTVLIKHANNTNIIQ